MGYPKTRVKWRRHLYFPILSVGCILLVLQTRLLFFQAGLRWLYMLLLSLSISFCVTPVFSRIAQKFDLMDRPNARKIHMEPTPLLGGAAVFIAFLISILLNHIFSRELTVILIAAAGLFGVGVADDFREIPASVKLGVQLACTVVVMISGVILRVIPESLGGLALVINITLTVLWIIGITNAMNFFDGMDGLATGLAAIISLFLGIIAFQTQQPFLGWVSVALLGSCLGFLPYNFRLKGNAAIFLGDSGSTVLGFILACVAVYGEWAEKDPVVALVSPLLIFWVLIFDMVHITVDRVLRGKVKNFHDWIDYVGRDHLHHRLANVLGGNKKSVLFIYLLAFCLGVSAVVLRNARSIDALLLLLQACMVVTLVTVLERRGRQVSSRRREDESGTDSSQPG